MSGRMQGMRYETIPEADEEVEPEPKCTTGFNSFSILVLGFLVMAIGGAIYISFHASPINKDIITLSPVAVIQTSKSHGDNLHAFTADKMIQRGMKVPNAMLGFGNVDCKADAESCANVAKIRVNKEKQFQMILGFGGAFTESSAYVYYKLPRAVQKNFIDLYFGDSGIGYSMGRVHINSCDFGLGTYSYDDVENDYKLEFFEYEVLHDRKWLIPFIKTALEASKRPIKILASPWSPPWWMKQPNKERHNEQNMTGSNDPQGLRDEPLVKNAWADYIVKWIFAFGWRGIPVWGITVQNEPKFAAPWEALKMTDDFQRDFVNDYLGPQMDKSHPDVKLLIFDHNKNNMTAWIDTVMAKLKNNLYVDGVAFHWYAGSNDREMDGTYGYDQVNMTHTAYPDKILLASEGCSCPGVLLNDWFRAERFAHDVVFDLQGWIDWNLLLDADGGPNHKGNNCDAPILANTDYSGINIQPKFYVMGHFSRYVVPGSRRIDSHVVGDFRYDKSDPRVREGFEAGLFSCERSSRQMWRLTSEGLLALTLQSVQDGMLMDLCIAAGQGDRPFLRMVYCTGSKDSEPIKVALVDGSRLVEAESGLCFGVVSSVTESGALLELAVCSEKDTRQRFSVDSKSGEVRASVGLDLCLTAGWPLLAGVSFINGDETVTVLINEASTDTEVVLHDVVRNEYIKFGINARSIQTILYK